MVARVTQPETGLCACILHREAPALSGQVETVQELCEKMDGGEVDASEAKMLPCGYVPQCLLLSLSVSQCVLVSLSVSLGLVHVCTVVPEY